MDKETSHCKKRDRSKSRKENVKSIQRDMKKCYCLEKKGPAVLDVDSGKNFKVLKETS
jgi:hypothetical protein